MKKAVKAVLHRVGLLTPAQHLYFNIKAGSFSTWWQDIQYRRGKSPDTLPFPPPKLIFDVIACRWAPVYYESGKQIVEDMERQLEDHGLSLASFHRILDFGCGCGRLIRHVHTHAAAELYGSDYNPNLIAWCRANLPFATFATNELAPPLAYADETFDFIYARSVFTHLPQHLQTQWMRELRRVLKPGGCLYFTMHGRPLITGLSEEQQRAFDQGMLIVTYSSLAGENLCSTYAPFAFVKRELADGFTILGHIEGRDAPHLKQDIYLFQK